MPRLFIEKKTFSKLIYRLNFYKNTIHEISKQVLNNKHENFYVTQNKLIV